MSATNTTCAHGNVIELFDEVDEVTQKATGWKIPIAQTPEGEVCPLCPKGVAGSKFLPGETQEQGVPKPVKLTEADEHPDARVVVLDYVNHRGVRVERRVKPLPGTLRCTSTPWHSFGWVFDGIDVEKGEMRTWALSGVEGCRALWPPSTWKVYGKAPMEDLDRLLTTPPVPSASSAAQAAEEGEKLVEQEEKFRGVPMSDELLVAIVDMASDVEGAEGMAMAALGEILLGADQLAERLGFFDLDECRKLARGEARA